MGAERRRREPVFVDLALQGGGSHRAFACGVLDRLLEEPRLRIDGISGTPAGAMNAAVLADGHAEGARAALDGFWSRVGRAASLSALRRGRLRKLNAEWAFFSMLRDDRPTASSWCTARIWDSDPPTISMFCWRGV